MMDQFEGAMWRGVLTLLGLAAIAAGTLAVLYLVASWMLKAAVPL